MCVCISTHHSHEGVSGRRCYLEKNDSQQVLGRRRSEDPDKLPSSPNWTAIKLGFPIFSKGICWGVGNGWRKNLWTDSWIRGHSLRELVEALKAFWLGMKWTLLFLTCDMSVNGLKPFPFKNMVMKNIQLIMWKRSKDGEFTTNSAYLLARAAHEPEPPFLARTLDLETWHAARNHRLPLAIPPQRRSC